jgi:hypothetical protein
VNYELFTLMECVDRHIEPLGAMPAEVRAILAAADAAQRVDHGDAAERMVAAIAAGDADAAHAASAEGAVQLSVNVDLIERTANEAARAALRSSHAWSTLQKAHNEAGAALSDALKHADPTGPVPLLASEKTRQTYADFPAIIARVEQTAAALTAYMKVVEGVNVTNAMGWPGGPVPLLVNDDPKTRRCAYEVWTFKDRNQSRPVGVRLMEIAKLGAKIEAPPKPVYVQWELPALVDGIDPLTASPAELEAAHKRDAQRGRDQWGRTL